MSHEIRVGQNRQQLSFTWMAGLVGIQASGGIDGFTYLTPEDVDKVIAELQWAKEGAEAAEAREATP